MFHRVLNLITMMYNESEELTVCHFLRDADQSAHRQAERDQVAENEAADELEGQQAQQAQQQARGGAQSSGGGTGLQGGGGQGPVVQKLAEGSHNASQAGGPATSVSGTQQHLHAESSNTYTDDHTATDTVTDQRSQTLSKETGDAAAAAAGAVMQMQMQPDGAVGGSSGVHPGSAVVASGA